MSGFNAVKQKLSPEQEAVLINLILISSDWGVPLRHNDIIKYANIILMKIHGDDAKLVGKAWIYRFLDRHYNKLQTYWSKPLDTQRAKSLNFGAVQGWFDILEEEIIKKGILQKNIYGMDESGFPPSDQGSTRVVRRAGNKIQHKSGGANRENITVLVTICADGTKFPPTIIFKGEKLMRRWCQNNVADARCIT